MHGCPRLLSEHWADIHRKWPTSIYTSCSLQLAYNYITSIYSHSMLAVDRLCICRLAFELNVLAEKFGSWCQAGKTDITMLPHVLASSLHHCTFHQIPADSSQKHHCPDHMHKAWHVLTSCWLAARSQQIAKWSCKYSSCTDPNQAQEFRTATMLLSAMLAP